jgi:co-chaperonin GroES (HSP10)
MSVYSENMKAVGNKVLLKKLVPTLDKRYGNIILPQSHEKNSSVGLAQVIDLGKEAKAESGLNIGDYVFYDYFSVYHNNQDYVITKAENILVQIEKVEADSYLDNYVITVN